MAKTPGGLPPALVRAWQGIPAPRRGPRPAYGLGDVVAAALALADARGLAAVTLGAVAARLELTPNALYRYVASKDELLVFLYDAGLGTPPPAAGRARAWRAGARTWTRAVIACYRQRPWLLEIPVSGPPMTPNAARWFDSVLTALAPARLAPWDAVRCALILDSYARGMARLFRDFESAPRGPRDAAALSAFLAPLLRARGLLQAAALVPQMAGDVPDPRALEREAEFGIDRILDGIAALAGRRTASRS